MMKKLKSIFAVLVFGFSLLGAQGISAYVPGEGDGGGFFDSLVPGSAASACGRGARGYFLVWGSPRMEGCDYVMDFDSVECFGNGTGRVLHSGEVRLPQQSCVNGSYVGR